MIRGRVEGTAFSGSHPSLRSGWATIRKRGGVEEGRMGTRLLHTGRSVPQFSAIWESISGIPVIGQYPAIRDFGRIDRRTRGSARQVIFFAFRVCVPGEAFHGKRACGPPFCVRTTRIGVLSPSKRGSNSKPPLSIPQTYSFPRNLFCSLQIYFPRNCPVLLLNNVILKLVRG